MATLCYRNRMTTFINNLYQNGAKNIKEYLSAQIVHPLHLFLRKRKKSCQGPKDVRDILCLPGNWCTRPQIPIPRGGSYLTENGKIEFNSVMSSKDIVEVSCVFASQVALSTSEIEDEGKRFNFFTLATDWCRVPRSM